MSPADKDPISAFIWEVRGTVSRTDALLKQFSTRRQEAHERMTTRGPAIESGADACSSHDLFQELQLRDDELRATIDELHAHIDELRRASALLERERMKYFDLFVHAPEAYVSTDDSGFIQEANLASAELLATEPQLLTGRPLISFVARQDTRTFRMHLNTLREWTGKRETPPMCRLRMRPRGQSPFPVALHATLLRASSNKPVAIRWNLCRMGISGSHAAHAMVYDEMVGTLARGVREPLSTIASWAKLLRDGQVRGELETGQVLEWIERMADAQRTALNDVVDTLENVGDEGNGAPQEVDVSERILKAVTNIAPAPERNRLAMNGLPPPGVAVVRSAPKRFERVLELLLHRALDGTARNGIPVAVRVWTEAGEAVVDIETPEGARLPQGWELRVTLAARIIKDDGGSLVLNEASPSVRIRLPLASAG